MKKYIIIILCLLISNVCIAQTNEGVISNKRGLVFQALDNGALGYICPKWALDSDDCRSGQFVYFNFNHDFVDNQMFSIPKSYYFYAEGVYKYLNRENHTKTVRKIELYSKY